MTDLCDNLKELPSGEEPLRLYPYLDDMRHLILKTSMHSYELYGISFLLKSCTGLEMLTIDLGPARIFAVSVIYEDTSLLYIL